MLDGLIRGGSWFSKPIMDFAAIIARQRACFQDGTTRGLDFRRKQLSSLAKAIQRHEAMLSRALHEDLRKSAYEAYASEIGLVLSEIRHATRRLPRWMKAQRHRTPRLTWPSRGYSYPEPYGITLIIGPWNYPFQLLFSPLVGALAAGNCAVLKPSEFAPRTAAAVAELIQATFPAEVVTVVNGERETGEALLRERFDKIFFTGSTEAGRSVMTAAAKHLTPVTLELGGKCPCLVFADAPIDVTVRRILWGKFMNAGQTCVAPDFVLVDRRIEAALLQRMKEVLPEFYGADPQKSPHYTRIINRRHFDRLVSYLPSGRVAAGGRHQVQDLYIEPTILTDTPLDSRVMQEEIFGPILPVLPFDSLESTVATLRDRPTPLALYLFTRDRHIQESVLRSLPSGGAALNDTVTHIFGAELPFGGLGESGMGTYHGKASFDCFTHYRSVLHRSLRFDSKVLFPPARISLRGLKRIFRFVLGG